MLHLSKFKAFADDNSNKAKMAKFVWVENTVGKEENAGDQHLLHFPQCFSKALFLSVIESQDCVVKS